MKTIRNISVIGDGGWGTTLAILLARKKYEVTLWGAFPEYIEELKRKRVNTKFLPNIPIPDEVRMTASLDDALKGRDLIVLAVPSQHMRSALNKLKPYKFSEEIFVSVTKGIENKTLKRMSEVIKETLCSVKIAVLSGPTIAHEVALKIPTTIVASSDDMNTARVVQDVFMADHFRVYASEDVIGTELGGSLKNVIAIAAGISDGLKFGTNAKAALLTRGLVEMVRLGVAMGAKKETFYGLSGLGDLATTCISPYSRNRHFGEEIGRGMVLKDALKETEMVVEGVATTQSAYDLAKKYKIEMPIITEIYKVIYENKDPKKAVIDLMTRPAKAES
jgi:glycerol-3-phosphate dehydrogenase (NAD(P)+)